ncbi:hypothetical protein [Mucilaginibacter sp. OK283]|uniref:hypothetical protein n=1 Tax=Mucilaginibacter sp. OK283 TaxID=1881049 RepID=UPI0008C6CB10|nr:hypothetical protein [Mucilaginibacter sp. OK283]SEO66886.1 hypothetical protein SAMN05428947_103337 [Mucilaginibacter sp. OK283]
MKYLLAIFFVSSFANFCAGQQLGTKAENTLKQARFIDLYKMQRNTHDCLDSKSPPIIANNKVDSCFHKIKKLSVADINTLTEILLSKHSYQKTRFEDCFASEFGVVIFNEKHVITGFITFCLGCNNLDMSNTNKMLTVTDNAKIRLRKIIH